MFFNKTTVQLETPGITQSVAYSMMHVEFACPPRVCLGSIWHSCFLLPPTTCVRLFSDSKLPIGVIVTMNGCLSLNVCPAMGLATGPGYTLPLAQ